MACGTPVVAVNEGGMRESVKHGETGVLVDREPWLFGEALRELLDNPAKREKLGYNAHTYVQAYWTWGHAYQRFRDVVDQAMDRARAPVS